MLASCGHESLQLMKLIIAAEDTAINTTQKAHTSSQLIGISPPLPAKFSWLAAIDHTKQPARCRQYETICSAEAQII